MRRAVVLAVVMAMSGAAAADKQLIADTEEGTYAAINANLKMQRALLSALILAADGLQLFSKVLVAKERRMARETVYVNPAALREARRLLEKSEEWRAMARRQLKDRKLTPLTRPKLAAMANIASCIVVTETDDPTPDGCTDVDTAAAVKWAIAEEEE